MSSIPEPFELRIPVLLCGFVRYDTASRVFEAIRKARPPRFYFACDGPRNEAERVRTEKVRSLIDQVDWPCEVYTLFHDRNKGTKYGMVENMDWFFEREAEGVVLEDDILPDDTFFRFAQELLEKYRNDERVWSVIGNNLATDGVVKDPDGYWFMEHGYGAYSGWAGWRRSWKKFDIDLKDWPTFSRSKMYANYFINPDERAEADMLFRYTWDGNIPGAWDYQFDFAKIMAGAVNIIPNVNLCRNIGFGDDATHSRSLSDLRNQEHLHQAAFPLKHPSMIEVDKVRNLEYFNTYVRTPRFQRLKNHFRASLPVPVEKLVMGTWRQLSRLWVRR